MARDSLRGLALSQPAVIWSLVLIGAALAGAFGPDPFAPVYGMLAAHGGILGTLTYYGFLG